MARRSPTAIRPADRTGYEMFRRVVTHLSAIQDQNQLHAEPLVYNRTWTIPANSVTAEGFQALQKEYLVTYNQKDNSYTLRKQITGPILITNYDPDTLSPDERARLIDETEEGHLNDVSFDIRPGHVGGEYPTQGRFPAAELQYHSQLSGPIARRRPRIPCRQRSADPSGPGKPRPHDGAPAVGWRALGSRPVDSVPWEILRGQHHRTAGTLEPRGLPNAVSLVPNDRQRGASRRSPQHHDCEVTGPQHRNPPANHRGNRALQPRRTESERLIVRQLRITRPGDLYCHPHKFAVPFSEWNTPSPAPLLGKRFRWFWISQ